MFTRAYWQDVAGRSVRTFAQTLVAMWGAGQFNVLTVDWSQSLGVAAGASVLSVLMSVAAPGPVGGREPEPDYVGEHRRDG